MTPNIQPSQSAALDAPSGRDTDAPTMQPIDQVLDLMEAEKNDDCWLWRDRWAD